MRKYVRNIAMITLALSLVGCGNVKPGQEVTEESMIAQTEENTVVQEENMTTQEESTTPQEENIEPQECKTISPLPVTIDMEQLDNCTVAVSFEEGDAYVDDTGIMRLDATVYTYDLFDMEDRYNQVLRGGMELENSIGKLMQNKLQRVGIVEGLNSKDPSFNPKVDMMDLVLYQGFMDYHPEVLNLKEKVNTMDKEFLNDLLATGGEKYANMKVEIYDKIHVNTTNIGPYTPGEANLRVNVIINGKEIAQLEDPEAVMEAGRSM